MSGATILVTGAGGPAGRSLCAQLLRRGHRVIGADMQPLTLPGVGCHRIPAAHHPDFVPALVALARRERAQLLVPTVTEELVVLAGASAAFAGGPGVVVAPYQGVAWAADKYLTCQRLREAGVPVPRFALPTQVPTGDAVATVLGWPYLSKPRVGRGGRGVVVHDSVEGAPNGLDDRSILQEFVPGTEYAPNLYLAEDPAQDVVIVLEKTALAQGLVGNASGVRRVTRDDVAQVARSAARGLGLRGPVDVDVRCRADGSPVVLEVNARFGANSAHAPEIVEALLAEHLRLPDPAGPQGMREVLS